LNCSLVKPERMPLNTRLEQSFGGAHITKNGKVFFFPDIWNKGTIQAYAKKCKTLQWVENQARKSPNNDWRLIFANPLWGAVYQRQGKNNWILVKRNNGFA